MTVIDAEGRVRPKTLLVELSETDQARLQRLVKHLELNKSVLIRQLLREKDAELAAQARATEQAV